MRNTPNRIWLSGLLCALVISMLAGACATAPKTPEPRLNIAIMQEKDLTNAWLGQSFRENPYLAPKGLVSGQKDEFIVLKIDIINLVGQNIEFGFSVLTPEGEEVAMVKSPEDMRNYLSFWEISPDLTKQREITMKQTYLPGDFFKPTKATESYYVVLMGKNPIKKPATVSVKVFIGDEAPKTWEFPLLGTPNPPKK